MSKLSRTYLSGYLSAHVDRLGNMPVIQLCGDLAEQ